VIRRSDGEECREGVMWRGDGRGDGRSDGQETMRIAALMHGVDEGLVSCSS